MNKLGITKNSAKEEKQKQLRNEYLLKEIKMTKQAISCAYSNLDNVTDPDLIDCYIYKLNSEQQRYKYLLKKAKESDLTDFTIC